MLQGSLITVKWKDSSTWRVELKNAGSCDWNPESGDQLTPLTKSKTEACMCFRGRDSTPENQQETLLLRTNTAAKEGLTAAAKQAKGAGQERRKGRRHATVRTHLQSCHPHNLVAVIEEVW